MSWFRRSAVLVAVPALTAGLLFAVGCSKEEPKPVASGSSESTTTSDSSSAVAKTPIEAGKAVLKGKVVFDGDPPAPMPLKDSIMKSMKDVDFCTSNNPVDQTWLVDPNNKGIQNVVVWLRAPKDKYLAVPDDQKKRNDTVLIDQPVCQFEPHVVALYPTYFDAKEKKQVPTGQTFKVKNSAKINHNTNLGGKITINPSKNLMLATDKELQYDAKAASKPDRIASEDLINIKCDIHPWMTAKAWVFDHPFAAVTNKEGAFEIKGLPEGELTLAYWHESFGESPKTQSITIKGGDNTQELKLKK